MKTVLIIDDIESVREHYQMVFSQAQYATLVAKDGQEGLAVVQSNPVDLIVADLRMPNMSGKEFITRVRSLLGKQSLPILVVSAEAEKHAEDLQKLGCRILQKPVLGEALIRAAHNLLG